MPKDSYGIRRGYNDDIKYSEEKDYGIGPRKGNGRAVRSTDEDSNWSKEDVKRTGLIMRQPL